MNKYEIAMKYGISIESLMKQINNDCKYATRNGSCLTGKRGKCIRGIVLCGDYEPKEVKE
jgi:hypothetical protein